MSDGKNVLLKIDGLHTSYGRIPMLMDVSLEFHEGSICCVLGANGAGKTTLIHATPGHLCIVAFKLGLLMLSLCLEILFHPHLPMQMWIVDKRKASYRPFVSDVLRL